MEHDSEDDDDDEMERDGGDDGEVTEENILLTMEFTGLPRVQVCFASSVVCSITCAKHTRFVRQRHPAHCGVH